jgi:hypothetical protein
LALRCRGIDPFATDASDKKRLSCSLDRFLRELRLLAPKRIAPNARDAGDLLQAMPS